MISTSIEVANSVSIPGSHHTRTCTIKQALHLERSDVTRSSVLGGQAAVCVPSAYFHLSEGHLSDFVRPTGRKYLIVEAGPAGRVCIGMVTSTRVVPASNMTCNLERRGILLRIWIPTIGIRVHTSRHLYIAGRTASHRQRHL